MFKTDYEKKRTEKVCHYDRRMERNFSLLVLKIFQNQLIDDGWLFVVNPMGSFINKDEMSIRAMPFRLFRKLSAQKAVFHSPDHSVRYCFVRGFLCQASFSEGSVPVQHSCQRARLFPRFFVPADILGCKKRGTVG